MGHASLKFWKAWKSPDLENRRPDDFDRDKRTLIVTGKVRADAMPFLEEDMSRPKSNTLDLKLQASQEGTSWKPVWFQKEIRSGDYENVHLLIDGNDATGGHVQHRLSRQSLPGPSSALLNCPAGLPETPTPERMDP